MFQFTSSIILLILIILIGLMIYWSSNFEIVKTLGMDVRANDFNFSEAYEKRWQEISESDFNFSNNNLILSNAHLIAEELIELTETEVKDYPLIDLPSQDIQAVFMILDSENLAKVLLNIDEIVIKQIYNKLTPPNFNKLIEKISELDKTKIHTRIK